MECSDLRGNSRRRVDGTNGFLNASICTILRRMPEPSCPKCKADYTYADGSLWVCPQCSYEWSQSAATDATKDGVETAAIIRDAHGNALADGDSVTVVKDLKVKGAAGALKAGTKVRGIRLVTDGPDGHNIACKIDGFGSMHLKSEFVKKS
jgi:protein PhnA